MEDVWEIALPLLAMLGSIVLAFVLLTRVRERARPEEEEQAKRPYPPSATRRQRRILDKFEPDPEIPTLMDLVRAEVDDLGLEEIPGGDGVGAAVLLKVYRRDRPAACEHEEIEYRVAEGVDPETADEDDVVLYCAQCAQQPDDEEPDQA